MNSDSLLLKYQESPFFSTIVVLKNSNEFVTRETQDSVLRL